MAFAAGIVFWTNDLDEAIPVTEPERLRTSNQVPTLAARIQLSRCKGSPSIALFAFLVFFLCLAGLLKQLTNLIVFGLYVSGCCVEDILNLIRGSKS